MWGGLTLGGRGRGAEVLASGVSRSPASPGRSHTKKGTPAY